MKYRVAIVAEFESKLDSATVFDTITVGVKGEAAIDKLPRTKIITLELEPLEYPEIDIEKL